MKREDRLKYCKVCKLRRVSDEKGIICSLTNAPAAFDVACTLYREDPELVKQHRPSGQSLKEAPKMKRLLNRLIDVIGCAFTLLILLNIYEVITTFGGWPASLYPDEDLLLHYAWAYLATYLYYFIFEATSGRTLGKLITNTRVVNASGQKPGAGSIALRTLLRFVPFDAFSFLLINIRGWHDAWSKTRVVDNQ
ncbi:MULTISPECIES: RDD family protein [unclassified Carboxylicivirga]|uniref:RDD family protein n=1 Tax=Carboxylicivirga TaxID=1628153 RepID=UPI003D32B4B2